MLIVPAVPRFTDGKRRGASQCGRQEHKDPVTRLAQKLSTDLLEDAMSPKLIALGVIAIVLWIVMMIVAPPQDTTHYSADAGDFASSSAQYMPH